MEERQFKGIWIPKEIWLSEDLTIQEKVILVEIDSLETDDKGCYASNKYFSNFFKLTTQRVSQIIKGLEEKNYLKVDYVTKDKQIIERQLRVQRPPYPEVSNIFDRGIKNTLGGYQENFKDNNINKNNINKKEIYKEKFTKPTLEEVQAYCEERNNGIDAQRFIDFYEANGWVQGKNKPLKDWKACIRTWEKRTTVAATPKWFNENQDIKIMSKQEEEEIESIFSGIGSE